MARTKKKECCIDRERKEGVVDEATGEELAFVEIQRSQPSVEIKRDAKGALVYSVKAYADGIGDALDQAMKAMDVLDNYANEKKTGGEQ
jgi:hypothetical protein